MRYALIAVLTAIAAIANVGSVTADRPFPEVVPLPDGFQPEGIATGHGTAFFVGSIPTGAVYKGDLRTGQGALLVPGGEGRMAIGLELDRTAKRLYVAGGPTGQGYVYDAETGANIASYQFTTPPTFINDVVVTGTAAYFTDSFNPVIYRVPVAPDGAPGDQADVETIPLSGDFVFLPGQFSLNGIVATPSGDRLIAVHTALGQLFLIDPQTGVAELIDLGDGSVPNGDGLLLDGKTLYVVQNFRNQIAVVRLSADLTSGTVVRHITDDDFRIPTTIAEFGRWLYAVNARFDTPPTPDTEYEIVQVPKR